MQEPPFAAASLVGDQDDTRPHHLGVTQDAEQSGVSPGPQQDSSLSRKFGAFWDRFGPFYQDLSVQITSLLAAISVISILKKQYQAPQCSASCLSSYNVVPGFSYPSIAPHGEPAPFVQFNANFITKACHPTFGKAINDILSVFTAMVAFNQVIFTVVNILKVSVYNHNICIPYTTHLIFLIAGIANWCDPETLEEGVC